MVDSVFWKQHKATFYAFLLCYSLFFITIISAHYLYVDDRHRAFFGYLYWDVDGRYFTYYLINLFTIDGRVLDVWPIPQLLSLVIMALVTSFIGFKLCMNRLAAVILLLPIFANHFYLENISYVFDSVAMTASVAFSLFAVMLLSTNKSRDLSSFLISSVLIFLSLHAYQISLNVFLVSLSLMSSYLLFKEDVRRSLFVFISGFISACLAFVLYRVSLQLLSGGDYSNERSSTIEVSQLYPKVFENFHLIFQHAHEWLGVDAGIWLIIVLLLSFVALVVSCRQLNEQWGVWYAVLFCAFNFAALLAVFGPVVLLENVRVYPRILVAAGVYVSLTAAICYQLCTSKWVRRALLVSVVVFIFYAFKTSVVYGNALSAQKDFEDFWIAQAVQEINQLHRETEANELLIVSKIPYAPFTNSATNASAIIDVLVPQIVNNDWRWTNRVLYTFGMNEDISYSIHSAAPADCEEIAKVYLCQGRIMLDFSN